MNIGHVKRMKIWKSKGIALPKKIDCRICESSFPNPILEGCGIVSVVCSSCKEEMCNRRKTRTKNKKRTPKSNTGGKDQSPTEIPLLKTSRSNLSSVNAANPLLPDSIAGWSI